ncbi:MAG: PQQ-binding-like beta-propeller repeat protein [Pseudomonadota bacterium]
MRKTPHSRRLITAAASLFLIPAAFADDYADARAEMVAAYQASEFETMEAAAKRALDARPGYPGALFNLAMAQVLNDRAYAALSTLERLAAQQIDFGVAGMDEFEAVRATPGWAAYTDRVDRLRGPVGSASVAFTYDADAFVPEGIAIDAEGALYLGSIRNGDIVRIDASGAETVSTAADAGHWSVYGMRLVDDTLWYVSSAIEQFAGETGDAAGSNGLFALDTRTGQAELKAALPKNDGWQVLGDFVIADDGTFFLSDQTDGVVYRYDAASEEFAAVTERGAIRSPQGLVIADAQTLYVADYIGGLYRVDLATGGLTRVSAPDDTSLYGIDGLYGYGDALIAIQNGIRPNRVVRLELSEDGLEVTASRILAMNLEHFDEPNLGTVVGDRFYFIANSHWNRFDRDGELPEGLAGPVVLRLELDD